MIETERDQLAVIAQGIATHLNQVSVEREITLQAAVSSVDPLVVFVSHANEFSGLMLFVSKGKVSSKEVGQVKAEHIFDLCNVLISLDKFLRARGSRLTGVRL